MPKNSAAKIRANAKYDATHTASFRIKLNLKTDADIIEKLNSVGNKQGYMKELIRADIAQSKKDPE